MSDPICVLRVSGRRFAAKRFLATSTLLPEKVEDKAFELTVSRAAPDDHDALIDDLERFLTNTELDLTPMFAFPGVERVALVLRCGVTPEQPLQLPARVCSALGRRGLELELRHG